MLAYRPAPGHSVYPMPPLMLAHSSVSHGSARNPTRAPINNCNIAISSQKTRRVLHTRFAATTATIGLEPILLGTAPACCHYATAHIHPLKRTCRSSFCIRAWSRERRLRYASRTRVRIASTWRRLRRSAVAIAGGSAISPLGPPSSCVHIGHLSHARSHAFAFALSSASVTFNRPWRPFCSDAA